MQKPVQNPIKKRVILRHFLPNSRAKDPRQIPMTERRCRPRGVNGARTEVISSIDDAD